MSNAPDRIVNILACVILLLFFTKITLADLPPLTHGLTTLKETFVMPKLRLENMDEEIFDISNLKNKVIVINFWATWCPPCRREMASLERLHQATADKNIVVLAVNVGEDIDTVFSFFGSVEPSPNFPIVFDYNAETLKHWKVKGLPTTYFIDTNGIIIYRAIGGREFDHPDIMRKILALQTRNESN